MEHVSKKGKSRPITRSQDRLRSRFPSASKQKSVRLDVKTQERPSTEQKSENGQEPIVGKRAPTKPGSSARHPSEPQYLGRELVLESREALGKD